MSALSSYLPVLNSYDPSGLVPRNVLGDKNRKIIVKIIVKVNSEDDTFSESAVSFCVFHLPKWHKIDVHFLASQSQICSTHFFFFENFLENHGRLLPVSIPDVVNEVLLSVLFALLTVDMLY
jgi:hypothetical protein